MARIRETATSRADLVSIVRFLRRANVSAARSVLEAIHETMNLLAEFPTLGELKPELAANLRSFPAKKYRNYLIFYLPLTDGIQVVRVLHGARNLRAEFRKS
jgi:toxin ParE1/3/4